MAGAHLALYVALPLRSLPKQINAGSGCLTPDGYWPLRENAQTRTTVRRLEVGILRLRLPVCRQFCRKSAFASFMHASFRFKYIQISR